MIVTSRECLHLAVVNMALSNGNYKAKRRKVALDYRRIADNYAMLASELAKLGL